MNVKKFNFVTTVFLLGAYLMQITACGSLPTQSNGSSQSQSDSSSSQASYWTGDGGRGKSITILPPHSSGITENLTYLPDLVANELVSNFGTFSAMTLFDRVNNQRQYDELLSGYYADDDKAGMDLGRLISTDYMLLGTITKTSTGYALQLTVNSNSDKTTLASYSGTVSIAELDNLTGVRRASLDLLSKMGVQLTAQAQTELTRAAPTERVNAQTSMAQGMTAQRQGTEVAALSYFFQAVAYDPSLIEAMNRSSVLNTNISSGNIGEDVRNDIVWRRNWVQRLTEAEQSFAEFNRTTSMLYTLFYSDEIMQGAVNYQNETVTLSIETYLHPSHTWGRTVGVPMQRTLKAVYDGLQATKKASDWGLGSWPQRGVTNLNSFARRSNSFTIIAELLNDQNKVIGRQNFQMDGWWEYTYNGYAPSGVRISDDVRRTVNFTNVKADDITDRLTIRIVSVNGTNAETAARNGVLQIRAMSKDEYDRNNHLNSSFSFALGEIRGPGPDFRFEQEIAGSLRREFALISIPDSIWDDPVVSIGAKAFVSQVSDNSPFISIYLPDSVAYIGDEAFHYYYFYSGAGKYYSRIGRIRIGANVTIENNSIFHDVTAGANQSFSRAYRRRNMMAGVYISPNQSWGLEGTF